ncbi:uncharacterized protein LOC114756538 [Neltuma alba]|uniref:uncharacterized protein LOC114756284 n=1 Tax=Neltuma alba TaxID=207710 RepID=UPI0010A402E1|nr:uncharacterized protein LOC114756284 [Prosopis alba]XP_028801051.1 uncharacterized protein LOC114756290 [Prosopis alba]XP_028801321.1 uncharacterized protein LOC114756538 [Prosopis alba]
MIAGDFNEIKTPLEQKGGGRVNEAWCRRFGDWIQHHNLIDVDTKGPFFTWKGPKWEGLDRVFKRLDRVLSNDQWQYKFADAEVKIVPRICSDHHPMLVDLFPENQPARGRMFRFEAAWQMHNQFDDMMRNCWSSRMETHRSLENLKADLIQWNRDVFGRIEVRKKNLLNRLFGVQRSLDRNGNPFLINLEKELEWELMETLKQEEMLWFQKSRGRWIDQGDRNTRYYHTKTLIRRRKNKIKMLKDSEGKWVEEESQIVNLFQDFYASLFREEIVDRGWIATNQGWGSVNSSVLSRMGRRISREEVKTAFFQMGGLKALGEDGFPVVFYHHNWHIMGDSVYKLLAELWEHPERVQEINNTLLVLIPKVERPELVS